jgi:inositol phosphorylceramide synthase catalytic subunit
MSGSYISFLKADKGYTFTKPKFPGFSSLPSFIPHKVRRKWRATKSRIRSRQSPTSNIAAIETSFSPRDTLRSLRSHRWSYYDGQYLLLAFIGIVFLSITQTPGPLFKMFIMTLLLTSLVLPATRQFFLPFLPIAAYLMAFFSCQ